MSGPVSSAVILAAGAGTRLRRLGGDRPKGLIPLAGTTPVERAVTLLVERGVTQVVLVAGFEAAQYREFATHFPVVTVVENTDFATTGSMASLRRALPLVAGDFLLLESDLVFEARALDTVLAHRSANVVLASGRTGATDEVWIEAAGGRLRRLSKNARELGQITGEFVGICRVSASLAAEMDAVLQRHIAQHGHARMDYETGALLGAAHACAIDVAIVPDLLWGEIDDERHYERVTRRVLPAILARERSADPSARAAPMAPAAYRYRSEQASLLLPLYRRLLWDRLLDVIPRSVSPNALTLLGTACAGLASVVALAVPHVPRAWLAASAALVLCYLTLDNLDGFHARQTGRSSPLGEFLDHWLDTLNSGLITVAVCRAVVMPEWIVLAVLACANFSFFAVHWAHRRTGAMRMGMLADIEANTLVAVILVAAAFTDPRHWSGTPFVLAAAMFAGSAWTVGASLVQVPVARRDWLPMCAATAALFAWYARGSSGFWPLVVTLAALNSLCTGRVIADRVHASRGPRFDIAAAILLWGCVAFFRVLPAGPGMSARIAWGVASVLGACAAADLASGLLAFRKVRVSGRWQAAVGECDPTRPAGEGTPETRRDRRASSSVRRRSGAPGP